MQDDHARPIGRIAERPKLNHVVHLQYAQRRAVGAKAKTAETVPCPFGLKERLRDHHAQASRGTQITVGGGVEHQHRQVLLAAAMPRRVAGKREQAVTLPVRLRGLAIIVGQVVPSNPGRIADDKIVSGFVRPLVEDRIAREDRNVDRRFRPDEIDDRQEIVRPCRGHGQRMQVEADDGRCGCAVRQPPAAEGGQQERPGAAGGVEQAGFGCSVVTDLVEHVLRQPVGRVIFAQGMPDGTGKERFVKRLEQIAAAGRVCDDRQRVVAGNACGRLRYGPLQCRRPGRDRPTKRCATPRISHSQGGKQGAAFHRLDQRANVTDRSRIISDQRRHPSPRSRNDMAHQQFQQEHVPRLQGKQYDPRPQRVVGDAVVPRQPVQAGLGPRPVLAAGLAEEGRPRFQRRLHHIGCRATDRRRQRASAITRGPGLAAKIADNSLAYR